MKMFLLAIVAALSFTDASACPGADAKKVVLFIDTNYSALEAKSAAEAACARGETFVILPAPLSDIRKVRDAKVAYDRAFTARTRCQTDCTAIEAQFASARLSLSEAQRTVPAMSPAILNTKLAALAQSGVAVKSIIASGHDGGGVIHGNSGSLNKYDIINGMKSAYKAKPVLLRQWSSVLMWGCFTATPSESAVWRSEVPSLRALAGFDGIGPSNEREASRDILKDFLVKEHRICEVGDQNELRRLVASVEDIQHTAAGMYIRQCSGDEYYYARRDAGTVFGRYSEVVGCSGITELLRNYRNELGRYYQGTTEPPAEGPNSPIREIYMQLRQNAQCIQASDSLLNPDRVGLLRFWEPYKKNVAEFFKGQTAKAASELNALGGVVDGLLQAHGGTNWLQQQITSFFGNEKLDTVMDFDAKLTEVKTRMKLPTPANISTMTRAQIIRSMSELTKITSHQALKDNPSLKAKMKSLIATQKMMNDQLYEMKPNCTPFEDWHEFPPVRPLRLGAGC
jgi:hypothetical protein